MTEYNRRAHSERHQPVVNPHHGTPQRYAPGLGGGDSGKRRPSNQIRKLKAIRGRVHGVSVLPSHGSKRGHPLRSRNYAPVRNVGEVGHAPDALVSTRVTRSYAKGTVGGPQHGPSGKATRAYPRPKARTRSTVAG